MSLLSLLIVLAVIGVLLWAVGQLPIDPTVQRIISVVAIVFLVVWVIKTLGLLAGFAL